MGSDSLLLCPNWSSMSDSERVFFSIKWSVILTCLINIIILTFVLFGQLFGGGGGGFNFILVLLIIIGSLGLTVYGSITEHLILLAIGALLLTLGFIIELIWGRAYGLDIFHFLLYAILLVLIYILLYYVKKGGSPALPT